MTDEEAARLRMIWTGDARMPCACRKCAPNLYPLASHGPVLGEGHATLRFGRWRERFTDILLDGIKQELCVEAYAPTATGDGWIIVARYDHNHHICLHVCEATGHPEACEAVRYGRVTIQREVQPPVC